MTDKTLKISIAIAFFFLFISALYLYLLNPLWDYDFWWHIATGKYIVTEGHLPNIDPFSYTSTLEVNKNIFPERERFFLTQYWLAQVIFYLIFSAFGAGGMVLTRSILLLLIGLIACWRMMRDGVKPYITFIFSFLLLKVSLGSIGERPVLFSMLFTALVIFFLEEFRQKKSKIILLLIPVMLTWANMHGAYVLGVIIISAYMVSEAVSTGLRKSDLEKNKRIWFFGTTVIAILITYLNPNGWAAFPMSLSPKYEIFQKGIQEYESIFTAYTDKVRPLDFAFLSLAILFPIILILRNRKLNLAHFIVLAGFFFMSMKAIRFNTFYAITAVMMFGRESNSLIDSLIEKKISTEASSRLKTVLVAAMVVSSLLFFAGVIKSGKPSFDTTSRTSVPERAVDFIEKNKLPGNMFNDYGYGGYIAWRLYPKKTFIDTRTLNITVMNEYGWVAEAVQKVEGIRTRNEQTQLWEAILRHYRINYVFMPLVDIYGMVFPIILELSDRPEWVPIYLDKSNIIFIKNTSENNDIIAKFRIEDTIVYNVLIAKLASANIADNVNPRYLISLGNIFTRLGRYEEALKAFRYAVQRWDLPEIRMKISELEGIINRLGGTNALKKADKE